MVVFVCWCVCICILGCLCMCVCVVSVVFDFISHACLAAFLRNKLHMYSQLWV